MTPSWLEVSVVDSVQPVQELCQTSFVLTGVAEDMGGCFYHLLQSVGDDLSRTS